jgi:glycerol uptake facilitator-like aquaporin
VSYSLLTIDLKFIELVGTTSLCYLSALIHITIGSMNTPQVAGYVGISNIVLLSLFIYAISPSSGGHINPIITFSTITASLTGFSRGVLYMAGQTIGGALAGGLIRGSFGEVLTKQ